MNDVNVSVEEAASLQSSSVSPNPVRRNGTVSLAYGLSQAEEVSVELVSISGRSLLIMPSEKQTEGKHSFQFRLPAEVKDGVYFLRIRGSKSTFLISRLVVIE
jgi:hypothetical protein